jgi:dTDP-4-amino-4,6-dideoxygalactose transaminase
MFYQLPPAGQPIRVGAGAHAAQSPHELFLPWQTEFFDSGTAALAAAIMAAIRLRDVQEPRVILPAYGCPDLVSAVLYAGATPVLVDLEPGRPWLDLGQLAARIGPQTVAIVAVDLFGIQERMAALRDIAGDASVLLIEDSAQAFPAGEPFWHGDLVVVSFGRGKPVSLLGGGAVLFRDESFRSLIPACGTGAVATLGQRLAFRGKALLYNIMSAPRGYWLPAGLPFLHLGETRFHTLEGIHCMDATRLELLAANVDAFRRRRLRVQSALADVLGEFADRIEGLVDLPAVCGVPEGQPLLRYPLLLAPDMRDNALKYLEKKGLGVSVMYSAALPELPGLAPRLGTAAAVPAARDFARRLLTLPVHDRVGVADIRAIATCLAALVRG